MKVKEITVYLSTILANILLGFLFTFIIFGNDFSNFVFIAGSVILLSLLIVFLVAKKLCYNLDIYAYDIKDLKYLILNSIFIGNLFSIPIAMFISIAL